jgi:hypothetical protein
LVNRYGHPPFVAGTRRGGKTGALVEWLVDKPWQTGQRVPALQQPSQHRRHDR